MGITNLDFGTAADGDGELEYTAWPKVQANFEDLDTRLAAVEAGYQPFDADLTTWAGLTPSANAQSLVTAASYAAMRALLDLEAGTDFYSITAADAAFQPLDADLTSWASVTRASGFDTFAATPSLANLGSLLTNEASGLITFMTTPSSANLAALLTDETGSGALVFATSPTLVTPVLGTPSSGTLTNCTGLPLTALVSDTTTALGIGSINLGHASDTTLTRSAAGRLAVEGVDVVTLSATQTLTAKTLTDAVGSGTWTASGTWTLPAVTAGGLITLSSGQIAFPAAQSASAGANTLDDYEEGTFTPGITFDTPGNLSVTYASQTGSYTKIGRAVNFTALIVTSAFTHTTASSFLRITGMPFAGGTNFVGAGAATVRGYTKAGFTPTSVETSTSTSFYILCSSSGAASTELTAADMPTGGTINIYISGNYNV